MSAVEGWAKYSIEECCEILDNKRIPINAEERELRAGSVPYYGANGLQGFIDNFIFDEDLILIAEDGGNFEEFATRPIAYQISGKSWVNNHAHVLRAKNGFNQTGIFYFLEHKNILPFIVGGTRAKLNQSELKSIEINLPSSKKEQTKIAEILSCIDTAIEQTEAMIAKQQRIKTGLMQDLLSKGIDEHGNIRTEHTHAFKDSPLGRIPEEWQVESCGGLCREIIVGIVIRPTQYYQPDGVPALRSANVRENKITNQDLVFMSAKDNESLAKSKLFTGDLVTVRTGYPGTTAVIPPEFDGCNCIDIVISRPKLEKIRSEFLSIWINSFHGKRQVLEGQGGLAQQHFNVGEMKLLLVNVPDIYEQERIENFFSIYNSSISDNEKELGKLQSLKTALMQDLLSGKVRVNSLL
jgi:type I restriction enzyme S subunit